MSIQFLGLVTFFVLFSFCYMSYFICSPAGMFSSMSMWGVYKKIYVSSMHSKKERFSALGSGVSEGLSWIFDFTITLVLIGILPWGFPGLSSWEVVAGLMPSLFYSVNILQTDVDIFSKSLKFKQSVMKSFAYFPLLVLSVVIRPVTLTVRMLANALVGAVVCHSLAKMVAYGVAYSKFLSPKTMLWFGVILIWELVVMLVQSSLFLGLSKIYFRPTPVKFKVVVK
ncbi:ATP synthase F0 subunit 6 (mitochondrion) [Saccostrea cucullata]|uniref:ATP synthase F0 subunit 6 n=1 Tax=Saccostrea cuccullata TaxID=36930 RepID=A0A0U1ZW57_9BIVA|nr:ATP synthase F0 subunit 6 [Saccostrea cucullata]AKE32252.1 ATP synthase F0 subunit 6 [Saccostrea cucullata]